MKKITIIGTAIMMMFASCSQSKIKELVPLTINFDGISNPKDCWYSINDGPRLSLNGYKIDTDIDVQMNVIESTHRYYQFLDVPSGSVITIGYPTTVLLSITKGKTKDVVIGSARDILSYTIN
jgi:hypothetical protein